MARAKSTGGTSSKIELVPESNGPELSLVNSGSKIEFSSTEDGFAEQPVAPKQKGPFLVGKSDIGTHREITRKDFASVGIQQDTLVFDWTNEFRIPLEGINPAAVSFLVENEYGFSVSDE